MWGARRGRQPRNVQVSKRSLPPAAEHNDELWAVKLLPADNPGLRYCVLRKAAVLLQDQMKKALAPLRAVCLPQGAHSTSRCCEVVIWTNSRSPTAALPADGKLAALALECSNHGTLESVVW